MLRPNDFGKTHWPPCFDEGFNVSQKNKGLKSEGCVVRRSFGWHLEQCFAAAIGTDGRG